MSLIKCPECGKEVSDKAEVCVECGYPICKINLVNNDVSSEVELKNLNTINIDGKDIDITQVIFLVKQNNRMKAIKKLRDISNLSLKEAKNIADNINDDLEVLPLSNHKMLDVKCPRCGSIQVQLVNRKWSIMTGFLTNKVDRICMNCKHRF